MTSCLLLGFFWGLFKFLFLFSFFFFKKLFKHLPKQRRLAESDKEKAKYLMSMHVNKKMLQQELSNTTGKPVTLRDLTNLAAQNKKNSHNDLENVVNLLQNSYGWYKHFYHLILSINLLNF